MSSEELFEKYKAQFEKETRQKIEKEYEQELERIRARLEKKENEMGILKEENLKLKMDIKEKEKSMEIMGKEFKEKLTKYGKDLNTVEWKMAKLKEFCGQVLNKGSNKSPINIDYGEDEYTNEQIPAVLNPEYHCAVEMISSFLDPGSFMRLISTNSRLYSMAQNGSLSIPLKMQVCTETLDPIPHFQWKNRTYQTKRLDIPTMISLSKMNYLRYQLDLIEITPSQHYEDYYIEYDNMLERLLVWADIHYIDQVKVISDSTDYRFLKFCKVRRLEASLIRWATFLDYPNILKVEDIHIEFRECDENSAKCGWDRYDYQKAIEDKMRMIEFVKTSSAHSIYLEDIEWPFSSVIEIMEMWQSGEKNFRKIQLQYVLADDNGNLVDVFLGRNKIVQSDGRLEDMTSEDVKKMLDDVVPLVMVGTGDVFIIVRDDLQMLSVDIRYRDSFCNVKMQHLV